MIIALICVILAVPVFYVFWTLILDGLVRLFDWLAKVTAKRGTKNGHDS